MKSLTRINRKFETRNPKSETNSKFKNSNVSNKIIVAIYFNQFAKKVDSAINLYECPNVVALQGCQKIFCAFYAKLNW